MTLGQALRGAAEPARFLYALARPIPLVLMEGSERSAGKPLSVLCAHTAGLKEYVLRRVFAAGARERALGSLPSWSGAAAARALAPEADLLFWFVRPSLERLPRAGVLARLPAWVELRLDLKSPLCLARGKEKFTRAGNASRKAGFVLGATRDENAVAGFYQNHFLPYVLSRHGESADIQSLEETMSGVRSGGWELLTVSRGGELVAGATVEFSGASARFRQLGVRGGEPALLAEGVSDAVYHHMLTLCRERGCKTLDLGSCRPFTQDGVLEYKRRFGAYAVKAERDRRGSIDLSRLKPSPASADFLVQNPLIDRAPGGGQRLRVFARDAVGAAQAESGFRERYCFMGTLGLSVETLEG